MEIVSSEEARIREEIQMDVERDLEEEIKEGICHLALRLQRLYQQQVKREAIESSCINSSRSSENRGPRGTKSAKILSEVNINIKLEGGTSKIEIIKEMIKKQQQPPREIRLVRTPRVHDQMAHVQRLMSCPSPSTKKFDWVKSLRSGPSAKMDCISRQSRMMINSINAKTNA